MCINNLGYRIVNFLQGTTMVYLLEVLRKLLTSLVVNDLKWTNLVVRLGRQTKSEFNMLYSMHLSANQLSQIDSLLRLKR